MREERNKNAELENKTKTLVERVSVLSTGNSNLEKASEDRRDVEKRLREELNEVQDFSNHLLRYLAQIPLPSNVFSTLLSLIADLIIPTDDHAEIQSQRLVLESLVAPDTVDNTAVLESTVAELGRHPEYVQIARRLANEMYYRNMVCARDVITVARRHPSDIATWLPHAAVEYSYPWPPMLIEWTEFWYGVAEQQTGAVVPAVILDILEKGGSVENAIDTMIDKAIHEGQIDAAVSISVNALPTTVYVHDSQIVWREGGKFLSFAAKRLKEGCAVDVDGVRFEFDERLRMLCGVFW